MVKVLSNRLIDLDLLPGNKKQQQAMGRAKQKDQDEDGNEDESSSSDEYDQNALTHAQHAATVLAGTAGGAVKGVVDTTGNAVHVVGTGIFGTVTGLGKGLGNAAAYGGSAIGKSLGLGDQHRGDNKEYEGLSREDIRKAKHEAKRRAKLSDEERWRLERQDLEEAQRRYEEHEAIKLESK
ncbi:hypothetical protein PMIN06_002490 [Paraphaeosphaeria minitans]|uniref:Uncharacterized protein n=1 Tax=Paraphaeosphaeria minitans TaxID=565426 RepID=A0A9P6G535_9PLEO|nr:hypothetical protein PMIN01_13201 [Paraphaeosphaeria minitans]